MIKELSPKDAKTRLDAGALLVDVREFDEVEVFACDVAEMLVVPLSEFEKRYKEIPADRELILVCAGGGRSLHAANFLHSCGYKNVTNLSGGVFTWNAHGLPVKQNASDGAEKSVSSCKLWY
ncbi:MAG: rhodanese-like domain-containing protein [bacterium]